MSHLSLQAHPVRDSLADRFGRITRVWDEWIVSVWRRVNQSPAILAHVEIDAGSAAVTTTDLPLGVLPEGLCRVSYTARIHQAGTVSSSLTITLGWTAGGVACSQAFAAITGNTTATVQSGSMLMRVDAATAVTYAAAYASVGATSMTYDLDVVVEAL